MRLTKEGQQREIDVMKKNLELSAAKGLSIPQLASILHTSFWNTLLRFIIIDGRKHPTNSMMHIRGGIFLDYTNPHQKDIRVSYDVKKLILFVEKMEMVPHPFTHMQRVTGETAMLCSKFGYEKFGYTDPSSKIPQWNKFGEEIPISKIKSLRIESFWDKPKAIWWEGEDYTAYKIIIMLKKKGG